MAFEGVTECDVPKCKEPCSEPANLRDEHPAPGTIFAYGNSIGVATEQDVTPISPSDDLRATTALVLADNTAGGAESSISRNKNHSSPIPTDHAEIATAQVNVHAGASVSTSLALVRPSLSAFNKKSQVSSASAAYQEQYNRAIAMSSAALGAAIKGPTKRIARHIGQAIALEERAKAAREQAQIEFKKNIGFYYEAKQRLLNSGYRADLDGGKNRTPDENQKNFGARDWETFNAMCNAFTLQHADRLLKQYAKCNGLLTDDGENIDDPEIEEIELARPSRRSTNDITAQKRCEHVATAAMAIASSNPEGEVQKQILAAAEYTPAPMTPLQPDIYSEVLSFVTMIATLATSESVKADAKKLLGKLLLFRPAPDPAKILAEATAEEKRKRDGRLAKKNRQPLGSSAGKPPSSPTPEHVQGLGLESGVGAETFQGGCISGVERGPESAVTVPASQVSIVKTLSEPIAFTSLAAAVGSADSSSIGRSIVHLQEVNHLGVQVLVDEDLSEARVNSAEDIPRRPANMVWTQLVSGKKYETRPAPLGGYGVYEPRSTVILQWFVYEDEARDAIDLLTAIEVGA